MEIQVDGDRVLVKGVPVGYTGRRLGLPALEGETVVYRRGRRVLEAPGTGLRGLLYATGLDYMQSPRGRLLKSIARRIASKAGVQVGYAVVYSLSFYESIHSRPRVSITRALDEDTTTGYPPADAALSLVRRYGLESVAARIVDTVDKRFQVAPLAGVLAYTLAPRGLYMMLMLHFNAYHRAQLVVEPPYYGGLPASAEAGAWLDVDYATMLDSVMAALTAETDTPAASKPNGTVHGARIISVDLEEPRRVARPVILYGRTRLLLSLYKKGLLDPLEPYRLTVSGGMAVLEYGRGERETAFYKPGIDPVQAIMGPYARCSDTGFRRLLEGLLPCKPDKQDR